MRVWRPNPGAVPITAIVDNPKESNDPILSSVTALFDGAWAEPRRLLLLHCLFFSLPGNQLAIQPVSFFFESLHRIPQGTSFGRLTYKGFEVSFSTASVSWNYASVVGVLTNEDGKRVARSR
jgi:hypothetical protein